MSAAEFGYAKPYTYGLIVCRLLSASIEMVTAVAAVATGVFAPVVAEFVPPTAIGVGPASGSPVATPFAATPARGAVTAPGVSARPVPEAPEATNANRASEITEIKVVAKP